MPEAAVRTPTRSARVPARRPGGRRPASRRAGNRSGGRSTRPSSGLLPLVVLLAIVTAISAVMTTLYRDNTAPGTASEEPRVSEPTPETSTCPIPRTHSPRVIETVYRVGTEREANATLMLAAFEAGWVESHMRNLDCGDRDSLGVFQQRPSEGWGDPEQLRDVRYAATQFFRKAEAEHRRHPDDSAGDLAQRVQRSAFPERYGSAETKARELLAEARHRVVDAASGP